MNDLRLYLFDDRRARRWAPFTLTRPVGELLFGCLTQRERVEKIFGIECSGHLTRSGLLGYDEPGAAPGIGVDDVGTEGTRLLLSSRAVPAFAEVELPEEPARISVGGEPAGWLLPGGAALPSELWLREPSAAPEEGHVVELDGSFLERPWQLVEENPGRIAADIAYLWPKGGAVEGAIVIGEDIVSADPDSVVEPGVHLDTRNGPIRLAAGVRVEGPARLTGPLFVGRDSTICGGTIAESSFGPVCLVRGEVAHSVFLGYDNKAHDGYIGHALIGRWVNLGAFTTNSDLKNNYRPVRVWTPEGEVDTGLLKVGCFLGDHVKTGIGTLLNTGTVIGAGSNVYGGLMTPTVVPPFSWGTGPDLRDHRLAKFLESAQRAMARRGQELSPGVTRILQDGWRSTAGRRAE